MVPSNMINEDDHWQVHYRGSVQACWKCLSTDHMSFRCRAKPRPKSNINWVPGGSHVDIVFPITEAEMDDPDFDYEAVSSQRSQMEEQWRRDGVPNAPSRDTQENWKEKAKEQEKTLEDMTRRANLKITQQQKAIMDLTEKLARMENNPKRGRMGSTEEGNTSKTPRVADDIEVDGGTNDGGKDVGGDGWSMTSQDLEGLVPGKDLGGNLPPLGEKPESDSESDEEKNDDEKSDEERNDNEERDDENGEGGEDGEEEDLLRDTQEIPQSGKPASQPETVIPNPGVNHLASQDTQPGQSGEQPSQVLPSQAGTEVGQVGSQADMFSTQQSVRLPGLETFSKPARERKEHKKKGSKKSQTQPLF